MNLDIRIKSISDIFTCINMEKAKQFIGKRGYFADCMISFEDLSQRELYTLDRIDDDEIPFVSGNVHWRYFLPVDNLKPTEKEYKPFNSATFEKYYGVGSMIIYRNIKEKQRIYKAMITSTIEDYMENTFYVVIRGFAYTLDELFEKYEICEFGEWKPFGVKEE